MVILNFKNATSPCIIDYQNYKIDIEIIALKTKFLTDSKLKIFYVFLNWQKLRKGNCSCTYI